MALRIEWRTGPGRDTVLVINGRSTVVAALPADASVLSKMLTDPGSLDTWEGPRPLEAVDRLPGTWGELVISRGETGEILNMDPELFWNGIYEWFRSRGIDYDQLGRDIIAS